MNPFDCHLQYIANRITIKDDDRALFTKDFDTIRDHILNSICKLDRVFNWIYKGTSLFGSYSNNVRIKYPDEFDVIFKLSVPFSRSIYVTQDKDRPGFVNLNFENVMENLENTSGYDELYEIFEDIVDWDNSLLRRSNLQRWLSGLFQTMHGSKIYGYSGDLYTLEYSKRGLAHTIFAHCQKRKISIDFIPAFVFGQTEWMDIRRYSPFKSKCDTWYAIPKPSEGPWNTRVYAFMICNPKAEHDLLLNKQNLKVVFRLLKSLRDSYDMPRLKSYFITSAFLWEIDNVQKHFWNEPLSVILIHMLDKLSDYFLDGELPFFWDNSLNLLEILHDDEIDDYSEKLCEAYNTLKSYPHQMFLTLSRCLTHFELPE